MTRFCLMQCFELGEVNFFVFDQKDPKNIFELGDISSYTYQVMQSLLKIKNCSIHIFRVVQTIWPLLAFQFLFVCEETFVNRVSHRTYGLHSFRA